MTAASPSRHPMARLGRRLGCSEGRAYSLVLGLVLAATMAVLAVPPVVRSVKLPPAAAPAPEPGPSGDVAAPVADRPTDPAGPVTAAPAPATDEATTTTVDSPVVPPGREPRAPRDPGYVLPEVLRPLEAAVGNLVATGCNALGLVSVVASAFPRDTPIPAQDLLGVLTPVYLACGGVALPETHLVCGPDRQVDALVASSPFGMFVRFPPVVGVAVQLATAPTDTLLGLLGLSDPLLRPSLLQAFDCQEIPTD